MSNIELGASLGYGRPCLKKIISQLPERMSKPARTRQNVPEHSRMNQNGQVHPVPSWTLNPHTEKSRANGTESLGSNTKNQFPGQGQGSVAESLPVTYKVLDLIPAW